MKLNQISMVMLLLAISTNSCFGAGLFSKMFRDPKAENLRIARERDEKIKRLRKPSDDYKTDLAKIVDKNNNPLIIPEDFSTFIPGDLSREIRQFYLEELPDKVERTMPGCVYMNDKKQTVKEIWIDNKEFTKKDAPDTYKVAAYTKLTNASLNKKTTLQEPTITYLLKAYETLVVKEAPVLASQTMQELVKKIESTNTAITKLHESITKGSLAPTTINQRLSKNNALINAMNRNVRIAHELGLDLTNEQASFVVDINTLHKETTTKYAASILAAAASQSQQVENQAQVKNTQDMNGLASAVFTREQFENTLLNPDAVAGLRALSEEDTTE